MTTTPLQATFEKEVLTDALRIYCKHEACSKNGTRSKPVRLMQHYWTGANRATFSSLTLHQFSPDRPSLEMWNAWIKG